MTELMRINHLKSLGQPLHRVDLSKFLAPGPGGWVLGMRWEDQAEAGDADGGQGKFSAGE